MNKPTSHCYGRRKRLLSSLTCLSEPWLDSSIKENFQRYGLDVLCALKNNQFATFFSDIRRTMGIAWSRQCGIQPENAYAV